ncbi:unnamed protein product [Urochloa humidicola]
MEFSPYSSSSSSQISPPSRQSPTIAGGGRRPPAGDGAALRRPHPPAGDRSSQRPHQDSTSSLPCRRWSSARWWGTRRRVALLGGRVIDQGDQLRRRIHLVVLGST